MKVIVTGGGGFVGKALCFALKDRGFEVISISRGKYPELVEKGIITKQIDLSTDYPALLEISKNTHAIFHVAAKVDMWGNYNDFFNVNVVGTRNIINICKENNIPNLIFTSSPSVIADGKNLRHINEDYPYPKEYLAYYPETKAIAEREVMKANSEELRTVSLRPHLIWGPGDNNFIPTILEKAKNNKLIQVGDGNNKVDLCYIDDCVNAHLLALDALNNNPASRGQIYFITQGEPVSLWSWINKVLVANGYKKIQKKITYKKAYFFAGIIEFFMKTFKIKSKPLLTKFLVSEMSKEHYFDISKAKKDLDYYPSISIEEGIKRTFN